MFYLPWTAFFLGTHINQVTWMYNNQKEMTATFGAESGNVLILWIWALFGFGLIQNKLADYWLMWINARKKLIHMLRCAEFGLLSIQHILLLSKNFMLLD